MIGPEVKVEFERGRCLPVSCDPVHGTRAPYRERNVTGFTWILVARLMAVIYDMRVHVACAERRERAAS